MAQKRSILSSWEKIREAPLGKVEIFRRGRGGGWRQVRAPRTPQPISAVRIALGDADVARWVPLLGRGSPVVLARDACALESFQAAPPALSA